MSAYTFSTLPTIRMSRRSFDRSHEVKTTMRVGKLTPIDVQEVLPGDGWYSKMRFQARLSTAFLKPVMDSFYMDTFHFFVPLRLLYTDYEGVFGNPSPSAYIDNDLGEFPSFANSVNIVSGSVGDYLQLSLGAQPKGLSVLKFRAFALIYEKWFRNENTIEPMHVQLGGVTSSENPNSSAWSPSNYTGMLPDISKFNDYFTSCLPNTQKGAQMGISLAGSAPLSVVLPRLPISYITPGSDTLKPFYLNGASGGGLGTAQTNYVLSAGRDTSATQFSTVVGTAGNPAANSVQAYISYATPATAVSGTVDLSSVSSIPVNDLRFVVQMQKMLEKDARGGSRYNEYIAVHYGVTVPDVRVQIPEYLGGLRTPLNVQQVAQTSQSATDNPLATLGAYSHTFGRSRFSKSFTEHGYIMTLAAIRYKHTYQQGIDRSWMRTRREDFYDPLFANLGEQPVYKWQLYSLGQTNTTLRDGSIFGYQEYGADYRFAPDVVTGQMRSAAAVHYDEWHFADNYSNAPSLNGQFTNENGSFFRRTTYLADNATADDFLCEFYFDMKVLRAMPVRSIPGLVDHH